MGSGNSKAPTSNIIKVDTHQVKVDGSLATEKETERRRQEAELMLQRAKEIEEHNNEMKKYDFAVNFFMDIEEQKQKKSTKKETTSRDKRKERDKKAAEKKEARKKELAAKKEREAKKKATSKEKSKRTPSKDDKKLK